MAVSSGLHTSEKVESQDFIDDCNYSYLARDVNLIALDPLERPYRVKAKMWYRNREAVAVLTACNEKGVKVIFDEPQLR